MSAAATAAAAPAVQDEEKEEEAPIFDPSVQVGALAPLGYFDPMGFCPPGDEGNFRKLQCSEIKHGRVAMMASIGLVVQHFIHIPLGPNDSTGLGILSAPTGLLGLGAINVLSAVLELAWVQYADREPGNFGDPFGIKMYTREMREKEISNCRMAMISVAGIFAAELATGKDAIQQFGFA